MNSANRLHPRKELTAAFSGLEKLVWLRLSDDTAHFTVVPDTGSQIWS
ncbi:hypothetical protein THARTR1_06112 [Trichoderma harzianum]|uniref:Uncharacterized protein n=1 Tax=Trichoderma harzianum TaxID=5544 RepID=A0A2K0U6M9_TRIHA|nr:hypothetical protein THARTR1_06112 [Trichoderma harzianum]